MTLLKVWVGGQPFAIRVEDVVVVLMMAQIDPMPSRSPALLGMLDLYGELIPVVDPALLLGFSPLGMPTRDEIGPMLGYPLSSRLLVVRAGSVQFALATKQVEDLFEVDASRLKTMPLPDGMVSLCSGLVWHEAEENIPILDTGAIWQEMRMPPPAGS